MAFAHLVYQARRQPAEYIRLSPPNRAHELHAVYTLLENGAQTGRVDLALKTSNPDFFQKLAKSVSQGKTAFQITAADGQTSTVTARPLKASHMLEFITSDGIITVVSFDDDDEATTYAMGAAVGAVAAVAIVAILVIGGMAVSKNGGKFSGKASKDGESSTVSVEAEGNSRSGDGDGGDGGGTAGGGGEEGGNGGG